MRNLDALLTSLVNIDRHSLPLRGSNDEWDRVAANLNLMLDRIETLMGRSSQCSSGVSSSHSRRGRPTPVCVVGQALRRPTASPGVELTLNPYPLPATKFRSRLASELLVGLTGRYVIWWLSLRAATQCGSKPVSGRGLPQRNCLCIERLRQRKSVKNLLTIVRHDSERYSKKS